LEGVHIGLGCLGLTSLYQPPKNSMLFQEVPQSLQLQPDIGPSRHMTIVFNAFVLMQVFNMINARKIKDEINVCKGIFRNSMFVIIFFIILVLQILLTQFTQDVMDCCRDGLDGPQWGISFLIGLSVFPVDFLLKFWPDRLCPKLGKESEDGAPHSHNSEFVTSLIRQRTSSFNKRVATNSFDRKGSFK